MGLSRAEAEGTSVSAGEAQTNASETQVAQAAPPEDAAAAQQRAAAKGKEPVGLPLRGDGQDTQLMVFLKEHCVSERVGQLPEALDRSVEHIVNKMTTPRTWSALYESITAELCYRAKLAAHALCVTHAKAIDEALSVDISLDQE